MSLKVKLTPSNAAIDKLKPIGDYEKKFYKIIELKPQISWLKNW